METNLQKLEASIGYQFQNQANLVTALTHRSCLNDSNIKESYERLEFLGDAVLEMLISTYLYKQYPDKAEGFLTSARSIIVRTESLSQIAKSINLGEFIIMSKGEETSGGRTNNSILEDCVESLIGSIYVDGGLEKATAFFDRFVIPHAEVTITQTPLKDSKSLLQEHLQAKGFTSPSYKVINSIGPDHDKTFESAVYLEDKLLGTGFGKSKQEAEQKAAQKALELV